MTGEISQPPSNRPLGLDPSVPYIPDERRKRDDDQLGKGGGGDPPDDMRQRIEALEAGHRAILAKLDDIAKSIADGRGDVREISRAATDIRLENEKRFGAIDAKLIAVEKTVETRAPLSDLNLIRGRIEGLPTTIQLLGFAVAVFVAAGIGRYFLH